MPINQEIAQKFINLKNRKAYNENLLRLESKVNFSQTNFEPLHFEEQSSAAPLPKGKPPKKLQNGIAYFCSQDSLAQLNQGPRPSGKILRSRSNTSSLPNRPNYNNQSQGALNEIYEKQLNEKGISVLHEKILNESVSRQSQPK